MEQSTSQNTNNISPKKPWFKTVGGAIFLVIISLILLGAIGFMGLFGYYTWQIKYGDSSETEKLSDQFNTSGFTIDNSLASNTVISENIVENFNDYIRPNNPVFGKKDAPVTILAFIDFECPYSQKAYVDFNKVMKKYEPVVKVVFKNLPLINLHPNAMVSAEAAMCANEQNKFWPYYDLLFTKQNLSSNPFIAYANQLNLLETKFSDCLGGEKYLPQITQDVSDAVSLGLRGTPTYFINGAVVEGDVSEADWDKIILYFLNNN